MYHLAVKHFISLLAFGRYDRKHLSLVPVMSEIIFVHVQVLPHKLWPAHGIQATQVQATLCTLGLVLVSCQRADQAYLHQQYIMSLENLS